MSDNPSHFKPGQSGNPAGRAPGSRNKMTKESYEKFIAVYCDHIPRLHAELSKLEGRDFINAMNKLGDFVYPRLNRTQAVNINVDSDNVSKEVFVIGGKSFEL